MATSASGQTRTSSLGAARPLPPSADIGPGGQSVGQAAQFCLAACAAKTHSCAPLWPPGVTDALSAFEQATRER